MSALRSLLQPIPETSRPVRPAIDGAAGSAKLVGLGDLHVGRRLPLSLPSSGCSRGVISRPVPVWRWSVLTELDTGDRRGAGQRDS